MTDERKTNNKESKESREIPRKITGDASGMDVLPNVFTRGILKRSKPKEPPKKE